MLRGAPWGMRVFYESIIFNGHDDARRNLLHLVRNFFPAPAFPACIPACLHASPDKIYAVLSVCCSYKDAAADRGMSIAIDVLE
jgi:hypothetical protein